MSNEISVHEAPDFATVVTDLADGTVNQRLSEKLAELVMAVEETGKSGTMTVKIGVKKEGTMAIVGVECTTKIPEHPMHGTLFHLGRAGALLRDDPRQLPLRNLSPVPRVADPFDPDSGEGGN